MKALKAVLLIVILSGCFAAGLFGAPLIRATYTRVFPDPTYSNGNFSSLYVAAGHSVVLFSTSTCPYCKKTREMFKRQGIAYTDYVTDKSKDAERRFEKYNGTAVPLIFIGDRKILGFDEGVIQSAIDNLAARRPMPSNQKD